MKRVKLLTHNSDACALWMTALGSKAIDTFMKSMVLGAENVTANQLKLRGADWITTKNPERSHSSAMTEAGWSVHFMKKYGNLVETGSKLVS
jgi:hypothetical protein